MSFSFVLPELSGPTSAASYCPAGPRGQSQSVSCCKMMTLLPPESYHGLSSSSRNINSHVTHCKSEVLTSEPKKQQMERRIVGKKQKDLGNENSLWVPMEAFSEICYDPLWDLVVDPDLSSAHH